MASELSSRIAWPESGALVDLGCGTGTFLESVSPRKNIQLTGVDLAEGMIQVCAKRLPNVQAVVADLEFTDLPAQSFDIVFSNAAIQWCDPLKAIQEMNRIVKPNGQILFSTFGPATLKEIATAWKSIGIQQSPVHAFSTMDQIKALLESESLAFEFWNKIEFEPFDHPRKLLNSLKIIGATNAEPSRQQGLMGKQKYARLMSALTSTAGEQGLGITFD